MAQTEIRHGIKEKIGEFLEEDWAGNEYDPSFNRWVIKASNSAKIFGSVLWDTRIEEYIFHTHGWGVYFREIDLKNIQEFLELKTQERLDSLSNQKKEEEANV